MALLLKHQTTAQFVARFREAYRNGERDRLVQLAKFVISRIQQGDITEAQCQTAFGYTAAKWTTLKGKMNSLIAASVTIQSAQGE